MRALRDSRALQGGGSSCIGQTPLKYHQKRVLCGGDNGLGNPIGFARSFCWEKQVFKLDMCRERSAAQKDSSQKRGFLCARTSTCSAGHEWMNVNDFRPDVTFGPKGLTDL